MAQVVGVDSLAMASDQRDWYRDFWRKKTGYVERAGFRVALGRPRLPRSEPTGSQRLIVPVVLGFLLLVVVGVVFRVAWKLLLH
jgi:hypothetical protein